MILYSSVPETDVHYRTFRTPRLLLTAVPVSIDLYASLWA
jgi:hypothetical protein